MKQIYLFSILVGMALQSCGQSLEENSQANEEDKMRLLAATNGFELTEAHFETYLQFVEENGGAKADIATQVALKSQLKATFLKEPEKLLQQLEQLAIGVETSMNEVNQQTSAPVETGQNNLPAGTAEGHKIIRELVGDDIGKMQFETQAANTFRAYVSNSVFTTISSTANNSYNSSDYSSSKGQIQFCANGTFVEVLSGHLSIDVEDASAFSSGSDAMPGYWEAAALPNDMLIILMYSTHSRMLEDFPNGFMPFVVTKHGPDYVQLPSGDLYRRTANQYCN